MFITHDDNNFKLDQKKILVDSLWDYSAEKKIKQKHHSIE